MNDRLAQFDRLCASILHVLLKSEPDGEEIELDIFETSEGKFALGFLSEADLADFSGGGFRATFPGRGLAEVLVRENVGLCLDPHADGEVFTPEDLRWLNEVLATVEIERIPVGSEIERCVDIPPSLQQGLSERIASSPDLAHSACLVQIGSVQSVVIIGAPQTVEPALIGMLQEALVFSGVEEAWSIGFLDEGADLAEKVLSRGTIISFPKPRLPEPPAAPGSDPNRPPRLK